MLKLYYDNIAAEVVAALDDVTAQKSWLTADEVFRQYKLAVKSMGGGVNSLLPDEKLQRLVSGKIAGNLYC